MKIIAKAVAAALLASMLLTGMAGCAGDGQTTPSATTPAASSETEPVDTRIYPKLPEKSFNGGAFNLWYRANGWGLTDIWVETEIGEVINDAVYKRNLTIETKYNVKINGIPSLTSGTDGTDTKALRSVILAGDGVYDAIIPSASTTASLVTENMLVNLYDVPHLDFDMPWWDKNVELQMTLGGKLYMHNCDITVINGKGTVIMYVNKDLMKSFSLDVAEVYKLASDGAWTFDKMMSIGKVATADLNGDGTMNEADRYAFLLDKNGAKVLPTACGEKIVSKGKDDFPYMKVGDKQSIEVLDYLNDKLVKSSDVIVVPNDGHGALFKNGQGMFVYMTMASLDKMREEDMDFGLLPMAKYNESQAEYHNMATAWCTSFVCVPVIAPDLDKTGFMLEAMTAESMYTLIPAYYEVALKTKYSRDEESAAMLDIIFETREYELADMYAWGGIVNAVRDSLTAGAGGYVSAIESKKPAVEAAIKTLIESVSK